MRILRIVRSGKKVEIEADIKTSFYTNQTEKLVACLIYLNTVTIGIIIIIS